MTGHVIAFVQSMSDVAPGNSQQALIVQINFALHTHAEVRRFIRSVMVVVTCITPLPLLSSQITSLQLLIVFYRYYVLVDEYCSGESVSLIYV